MAKMELIDEIQATREAGLVRGGLLYEHSASLESIAHHFGLFSDAPGYIEIDLEEARLVLLYALSEGFAYGGKVMSSAEASRFADQFLRHFPTEQARYYTNGNLHRKANGGTWSPMMPTTIDTGLLVISEAVAGCIWVGEDD